jgi:quercetin dioxygenase-like cupin family protein
MAIDHAQPGEAITLCPPAAAVPEAVSTALFKSADLEVMRLVLRAGKALPPHAVPGDITVQCLQGRLDVTTDRGSHVLAPGQLLYLPGGVRHGVVALDDACALVTIALKAAGG